MLSLHVLFVFNFILREHIKTKYMKMQFNTFLPFVYLYFHLIKTLT